MSGPDYVTPAYAADLRGCSTTAIKQAIRRGELAALAVQTNAKGRCHYAIHREALAKWTPRPVGNPEFGRA